MNQIALITCSVSRLLHLTLIPSLSVIYLIRRLKRPKARRGAPRLFLEGQNIENISSYLLDTVEIQISKRIMGRRSIEEINTLHKKMSDKVCQEY